MDGLHSAIAFVERFGGEGEQIRLHAILHGTATGGAKAALLLSGQRDDGGYVPFWAEDYSSVDATCYRLAQARGAGIPMDHPGVRRALLFLQSRQSADGSWTEDPEYAQAAPLWARPEASKSRIYLTANAGFWASLGELHPAARSAVGFLLGAMDRRESLPSFLHANWIAAALFWREEAEGAAESILARLKGRLSELSAGALAWLLTSLLEGGVPPSHEVIRAAAALLRASQRTDGAFPSEDGPDFDVHTTLEAMRALWMLG